MQEDPQYADLTPDGNWYQFTLTGEYIEVLLNEDSVRIPLEQWDALVKAMAPTTPLVYYAVTCPYCVREIARFGWWQPDAE